MGQEIIDTEGDILSTLQWNICAPTPLDFLQSYVNIDKHNEIYAKAKLFIDVILQEKLFTESLPSEVAAAATILAAIYDNSSPNTLLSKTQCEYTEIIPICRVMNRSYGKMSRTCTYCQAFKKHSTKHIFSSSSSCPDYIIYFFTPPENTPFPFLFLNGS